MLITVLLNDAWTLQRAKGTFFFSFLRPVVFLGPDAPSAPAAAAAPSLGSFASAMILLGPSPLAHPFLPTGAFFLPATVLRGPLRVRAFVCVLWPRTGRLRRWRMPL